MARRETTGTDEAVAHLLAPCDPVVRKLATKARALVRELIPDAQEEVDSAAKLIGYSYLPETYKGLILAIALQRSYVNLMFSKGVELMAVDPDGLLEGTGKLARHIKVRTPERLEMPQVRELIKEAAARTPR